MIVEGKKDEKSGAPNVGGMGGMEGMYWYGDYCSFIVTLLNINLFIIRMQYQKSY